MRTFIFMYLLVLPFFLFSQQDNSVIYTGDRVLTNYDSTNLWFLPKEAKIGGSITFNQYLRDTTSGMLVIYPVTTVQFECGEWVADTVDQNDWTALDSTIVVTTPQWVYSAPEIVKRVPIVTGVKMCPCGCPTTDVYVHKRIDAISGAINIRQWIVRYKYRQSKTGFNKLIKMYEKKQ